MYLDQSLSNTPVTSVVDLVARYDTAPAVPDWTGLMDTSVKTKQLLVSFTVILLWDFVITTGQTVELFWGHRWSISKIVFFLNRFNTSALMINTVADAFYTSVKFCHFGPFIGFISSIILISTFNSVLLIRVYALWNRSLWVFYICLFAFLAHIGSYIGILGYSYGTTGWAVLDPPFSGCTPTSAYPKTYVLFVNALIVETIIISLTVIKILPIVRPQVLKTPVFSLLLEDGLLYFVLIIITQGMILAAFFVSDYKYTDIILGSYPSCVTMGVGCNRLLLRSQELLLGKKECTTTEFNTRDLATISRVSRGGKKKGPLSSSAFTFSQDLPGERVEMDSRRKSREWVTTKSGVSNNNKRPGVIRIDEGAFIKSVHQSSSQSGSSVDKDVAVDEIMVERENVEGLRGGKPGSVPERDLFGDKKTILDGMETGTPRAPDEDEDEDETMGNLVVSRV